MPMFSHITLGVSDFPRALAFYEGLMARLGLIPLFVDREDQSAGWHGAEERPRFFICAPFNGEAATAGNGTMIAFQAKSRAIVDACHAHALAQGGRDEGAPGPRPNYGPDYYGAYFRDLDGNKLCVCCRERP